MSNIPLKKLIDKIKAELSDAQQTGTTMFELVQVDLEIKVAVEVSGSGEFDIFVAKIGTESKGTQTHTVKLTLRPLTGMHPSESAGLATHLSLDIANATNIPQGTIEPIIRGIIKKKIGKSGIHLTPIEMLPTWKYVGDITSIDDIQGRE